MPRYLKDALPPAVGGAIGIPKNFRASTSKPVSKAAQPSAQTPNLPLNLSGESLQQVITEFFQIPADNLLVVYDDTALAFGRVRFRAQGSAGSHNSMKSILQHCDGTHAIARFRNWH
ncbi:MAG: aminoacyl-tRNA hydrolase [Vampirovibrionales bacterium]